MSSPGDELGHGDEVVDHVERVHVADARQRQVELQGLLPVLTSDLQGHADGLALPLLQLRQVGQQAGAVPHAVAPQQTHAGLHQRRQRALEEERPLERTPHLA